MSSMTRKLKRNKSDITMAIKLFDEPKLLSKEMVELLSVMTSEKIKVQITDNILVFTSPDTAVYGTVLEGIDDFSIDKINSLIDTDFESEVIEYSDWW